MANIFTDQAAAYDGSSSPITGSAALPIVYKCTPFDGGILRLYVRPNGASTDYVLLFDMKQSGAKRFDATDFQYYYTWDPTNSSAVASLEG